MAMTYYLEAFTFSGIFGWFRCFIFGFLGVFQVCWFSRAATLSPERWFWSSEHHNIYDNWFFRCWWSCCHRGTIGCHRIRSARVLYTWVGDARTDLLSRCCLRGCIGFCYNPLTLCALWYRPSRYCRLAICGCVSRLGYRWVACIIAVACIATVAVIVCIARRWRYCNYNQQKKVT